MTKFIGDFSTGDFSQWPVVNNKDSGNKKTGTLWRGSTHAARIVELGDCGYAARFEVRSGEAPAFDVGKERSEVSGVDVTDVLMGETAWYAFSIKFDETFPLNQHALGWGIVCQWHDLGSLFSPVLTWGWRSSHPVTLPTPDPLPDGYWYLVQHQQDGAGKAIGSQLLLALPINPGQWHDIKMQIKLSGSTSSDPVNPDAGLIRVWHNTVPQTLLGGSTTFIGQTINPGVPGAKVQIGLYRESIAETGIVYHSGFRMADTESSL